MLPYLYIIKTKIQVSLTYRFDVITRIMGEILLLFATVYFWIAAYGEQKVILDTSVQQMIDYAILSLLLSIFYSTEVEYQIRQSIRLGNVAVDFIKPISIMGMYLAGDISTVISNLLLRFLPVLLVGSLIFGMPMPQSPLALLMFFISALLGFMIMWLINAIFGLFNFWVIELGPIGYAKDSIIRFLSGSMVPIWFFPSWVATSLGFLPFIYIYQSPISIYIGKMTIHEGIVAIIIQAVWVFILLLCMLLLQKKAFRNVFVQGG